MDTKVNAGGKAGNKRSEAYKLVAQETGGLPMTAKEDFAEQFYEQQKVEIIDSMLNDFKECMRCHQTHPSYMSEWFEKDPKHKICNLCWNHFGYEKAKK